jgi:protein TonB
MPTLEYEVKPNYTPEAMQARIQGSIWLSVVVLATGAVGEVTITKSLDKQYGLDDEAVKTVRQWRFKPGMKDGKPVAVRVDIEMTFKLK